MESQATGASHKAEVHTDFLPLPAEPTDPNTLPVEFQPDDTMSETGIAIWNIIVPDLHAAKVFRHSDTMLLTELCESLAMARDFRLQIKKLQPQYQREMDAYFEDTNPERLAVAEALAALLKKARTGYREMMQTAMSIAGEFGISPVARMRLGLLKLQGNSLMEALKDL